jgi:tetratricopeptide (TPR) repeat protein
MNDDAIARCRQILEQDPENELSLFSLGKALFERGDYAEARPHFAAALARKPDWMAAQILAARCEVYLGNKVAARLALDRALVLAREQGHVGPLAQVEELLRQVGPA